MIEQKPGAVASEACGGACACGGVRRGAAECGNDFGAEQGAEARGIAVGVVERPGPARIEADRLAIEVGEGRREERTDQRWRRCSAAKRARLRDGGKAPRPGAAHEAHQHRLELVVCVVAGRDVGAVCVECERFQGAVSGEAGVCLGVAADIADGDRDFGEPDADLCCQGACNVSIGEGQGLIAHVVNDVGEDD